METTEIDKERDIKIESEVQAINGEIQKARDEERRLGIKGSKFLELADLFGVEINDGTRLLFEDSANSDIELPLDTAQSLNKTDLERLTIASINFFSTISEINEEFYRNK